MTVQELISELKQMDQEARVHFSYNYGDHWRTQVAPRVRQVTEERVKHSAYHRMDMLVDEDDENEDREQVVVISA